MSYLATLDLLKARLRLPTEDVVDDTFLTTLLAGVTARAEKECNRKFGYLATSEEFQGDACELAVARFPIDETVAPVFYTQTTAAVGWQAAITDWIVRQGCIFELPGQLGTEKMKLKVTYTGGYTLPGDINTGESLPDDLVQAAVDQCAYWYQNKDRLGVKSMSFERSVLTMDTLDLVPHVKRVFQIYERWRN